MKYYVVLSFVIGYLYLTVSGETDETFISATKVSFTNTTNAEEWPSNSTNLEESSKNGTDLEVSPQDSVPYVIQNETEPILEHGIKSRIKGGFNKVKTKITNIGNKVKNKITNIGNKVKNKIKGIGTGGSGSGGGGSSGGGSGGGGGRGGGGGGGGYYRPPQHRYRKTTGTYSSNLGTPTILYIVFGVIGGVILITVICYFVRS